MESQPRYFTSKDVFLSYVSKSNGYKRWLVVEQVIQWKQGNHRNQTALIPKTNKSFFFVIKRLQLTLTAAKHSAVRRSPHDGLEQVQNNLAKAIAVFTQQKTKKPNWSIILADLSETRNCCNSCMLSFLLGLAHVQFSRIDLFVGNCETPLLTPGKVFKIIRGGSTMVRLTSWNTGLELQFGAKTDESFEGLAL